MRRTIHLCAIVASALFASPVAAQQSAPALPTVDQSAHSVPPAPPPERQVQTPPPFPSFPYVEPRRRRVEARAISSHLVHHRSRHEAARHHGTGHPATAKERKLSKRERKDERYCSSLSHRQLLRNSKCRRLMQPARETAHLRALTKQDKKDERRCASLSLRQVLRDSKCRKVAQRQLEAERDPHPSVGRGKHRHATSQQQSAKRHATVHREAHHSAAKRRRH